MSALTSNGWLIESVVAFSKTMGALGESATAHELVLRHRCPSRQYAVRVAICRLAP